MDEHPGLVKIFCNRWIVETVAVPVKDMGEKWKDADWYCGECGKKVKVVW